MSVRPYASHPVGVPLPIPAVVSQNVTNLSCLACNKSEKYTFLLTLRPLGIPAYQLYVYTCDEIL